MKNRTVSANGQPVGSPNVLLVGYNGANNTGAEALLLADIQDIRSVLGDEAHITVPTLNEKNLRRYLKEGPHLRIAPIPSIYFLALRRLVREHDLVILVEGSAYMDTWTSALLWAFLWTTRCAHAMHRPCLAYAVDAGELSAPNRRLVRREASKTDLIIVRAQAAAERLRSWGVTAPIEVTADNAFTFVLDEADQGWLQREWPEAGGGVVGMAVVNFYLWPVVLRPWGHRTDCYRWPYYFSHSPERTRAAEELAAEYAVVADRLVTEHGKAIALICMEELDEPFASQVHRHMVRKDCARVFCSRTYNASQMTVLLRSLDLLMTSRYHAAVLSMAAQVPQVAIGHDLRLKSLYRELGLFPDFFIDPRRDEIRSGLEERFEQLLGDGAAMKATLRRGYEEHLAKARRNRELLRDFVRSQGWGGAPCTLPSC